MERHIQSQWNDSAESNQVAQWLGLLPRDYELVNYHCKRGTNHHLHGKQQRKLDPKFQLRRENGKGAEKMDRCPVVRG